MATSLRTTRTRFRAFACTSVALLCAIVLPPVAKAQALDVPGYVTTLWRARDGAPGDIYAMTQTRDGWLWLGSSAGLYRFDGRSFSLHDVLPSDAPGSRLVSDLVPSPDGGLWVVYGRARVVHLAADGVTATVPAGLPADAVRGVFIDGEGRTFASVGEAIYLLTNGRWTRCTPPGWTLPGGVVDGVTTDATGAAIVTTGKGVYRLATRSTRFVRIDGLEGSDDEMLLSAPDGKVWRTRGRGFERVPGVSGKRTPADLNGSIFAFDRHGGFWTMVQGCPSLCLRREGLDPTPSAMADPARVALSNDQQGLQPMSLFTDRAGDVWAGGKNGLARFHPIDVTPVDMGYPAYYFSIIPRADGTVVVGTTSGWKKDELLSFSPAGRLIISDDLRTQTMSVWTDGRVLHAAGDGVLSLLDGKSRIAWSSSPPELAHRRITAAVPDGTGGAWVSVRDTGLFSVDGKAWHPVGPAEGFPDEPPIAAESDTAGHTWFGYADGTVRLAIGGRVASDAVFDSHLGTVSTLLLGDPVIVAGERGVAWFDGHAFHPLAPRIPGAFQGATGLARTPDGSVWINSRAGLARIDRRAIVAAQRGENPDVAFRLLTEEDGLAGGAQQSRIGSTLRVDSRGTLWAAGALGLVRVDPSRIGPPPPVEPVILHVTSERAGALPAHGATLAPDDTSIEVAFTTVALADPRHVQVRYRLRGVDDTWRLSYGPDVVRYAHLAPGDYRFEVQARNTEGDWSPSAVSGPLTRTPAFTETGWFRATLVLLASVLLFAMYVLRVRALRRRHAERTDAKLAERDRIARELHDSILQGVQAVSIRLSTWEIDPSLPDTARSRAGALLQQMNDIVLEGRSRVVALRSVGRGAMHLSDALRLMGDDHQESSATAFHVIVQGDETSLPDALQVTVLDVLREAIHNAFRHAAAQSVTVSLHYTADSLVAHVVDDGKGLPPDVRHAGRKPGHWGLVIMRERAEGIGADFKMRSDDTGTRISISVKVPLTRYANREHRPSQESVSGDR